MVLFLLYLLYCINICMFFYVFFCFPLLVNSFQSFLNESSFSIRESVAVICLDAHVAVHMMYVYVCMYLLIWFHQSM